MRHKTTMFGIYLFLMFFCGMSAAYIYTTKRHNRRLLSAFAEAERARDEAVMARKEAERARDEAEASNAKLLRQIQITHQWQKVSETDTLTGLLNRGGGERRIKAALESGGGGLFCIFDINSFKSINDHYGHRTGDKALRAVAKCMRGAFRDDDILFRLGGDEYAVFAPGICTQSQAATCIKRFFSSIESMAITGLSEERLSVSLGAVLLEGNNQRRFEDLYRCADDAMYRCKGCGCNAYSFCNRIMQGEVGLSQDFEVGLSQDCAP